MNKNRFALFGPALIFIAAMLWATDAPFRLRLTEDLSSSFIVLVEHFFGVVLVLPVLWWKRSELKKLGEKEWVLVGIIAIGSSALASIAFTKSFSYVNPSVAILLQKLQPLIAIGLAVGLLKEVLVPKFWMWALLALGGAYFVSFGGIRPQLFQGEIFNPDIIGIALAIAAAILWGAGTVLGKIVLKTTSFQIMTSLRFVLAFIFLLGMNLWQNSIPKLSTVTYADWCYLAIIAVVSGVFSLFIYYRGLQYTKASIATLAELGFPVGAVIINFWFLNSVLGWPQIFGMALLLFAVVKLSRLNATELVTEH